MSKTKLELFDILRVIKEQHFYLLDKVDKYNLLKSINHQYNIDFTIDDINEILCTYDHNSQYNVDLSDYNAYSNASRDLVNRHLINHNYEAAKQQIDKLNNANKSEYFKFNHSITYQDLVNIIENVLRIKI